MGFPILVRCHLYIELGPWFQRVYIFTQHLIYWISHQTKWPPFHRRHFQMHFKFVPKGPTDNESALVQVLARRRPGDKPLPEPMLARFSDTYMRHYGDELTSTCIETIFSCDQAAIWMVQSVRPSVCPSVRHTFLPLSPPAGGVLSSRSGRAGGWVGGRAGGCQTCGTHISVTAWWIFSIRSSVELSRPVVVHRHGHLPICPKWACPWPKNLSNLVQIGSRLCGTHISETAWWIDPI